MVKIKRKLILVLMVFSLLAASLASAAVEITETEVKLDVDYGDFTDDDQATVTSVTNEFTIKNTDTENRTVDVSIVDLPSGYSFDGKQVTVVAGGEAKTTLTVRVPHKENSGEKKVGTIKITAAGTELDRADLKQVTKSMLELYKLKVDYVDVDGNSETDSFNGDDEFELQEKVQPGSEITLKFELKNLFNDNYDSSDSELNNVIIKLDVSDDDLLEDNFEDEYDIDDLEAEKKQAPEIIFMTNVDTDAKEYKIEITLEAEDGKNVDHKVVKELSLDLERKRNDLRVEKVTITPTTITTCTEQLALDLKIKNFGTRDQKYGGVAVHSEELKLNENVQNIVIDQYDDNQNTWERVFNFDLDNPAKGTYYLDINVYYNRDEVTDHERLNIVVEDCPSAPVVEPVDNETEAEEEEEEEIVVETAEEEETVSVTPKEVTPEVPETSAEDTTTLVSSSEIVKSVENPYKTEDFFVAVLIVGFVLILALIIIFFLILLR